MPDYMDITKVWPTALLALTLWREARGESRRCRMAIAESVLNRVERPAWWGHSIIEVLSKRWQYSSLTDPRDRQLTTWPQPTDSVFLDCLDVAQLAVEGRLDRDLAPGADSYHDTSIPPPAWAAKARRVGQIDRIVFYDTDRDYERAALAEAA